MDYSNADYLALDDVVGQNIGNLSLSSLTNDDYLEHYQVKGAKHGVRRYQNRDGSLTPLGREHYGVGDPRRKGSTKPATPKKQFREVVSDLHAKHVVRSAERKRAKMKDYLRDHPEKLFKKRKKLSDDDIKEVMSKIEFDKKIKEVRDQEIERKLKNFETFTNKGFNILKNSVGMYNNAAMLYNALLDNTREPDPEHPRRRLAQAGFDNKKNGEGGNQKKTGDGNPKKTEGAEGTDVSKKTEGTDDSKKTEGAEGGGSKKSGGSDGGGSKKSGGSDGGGSKKSGGSDGGSKKSGKKTGGSSGSDSSTSTHHARSKVTLDNIFDRYGTTPISKMTDTGDWMRSSPSTKVISEANSGWRGLTASPGSIDRMHAREAAREAASTRVERRAREIERRSGKHFASTAKTVSRYKNFAEVASTPLWKLYD